MARALHIVYLKSPIANPNCFIEQVIGNVQLLEMVAEEYGGRVELAKAYYKALTASVRKHFKGNGVIASMEHCNDFMFLGTETISLGRVGMLISHNHLQKCQ